MADSPAGFFEARITYERGDERVEPMPFDEGVELFNRFRKAGKI